MSKNVENCLKNFFKTMRTEIFGIEDGTKKIVGVKYVRKSYEEVSNRIKTRINPSTIPVIDIVNVDGKQLIAVKVIPGNHTPYYYVNKGTRKLI